MELEEGGILTAPAWPGIKGGGGGGRSKRLSGSGGDQASCPHAKQAPRKEIKNQKIPGSKSHTGRERRGHIGAERPVTGEPPRGLQGPGFRPREATGGKRTQELQQAQVHSEGCRDERQKLEGGGCGRHSRGQRSAQEEELGSRCDREVQ